VEDTDHRELEDLDIARYYMSTGNYKAAYLRAKDAIATIPDDPNAYFALAAAAERLNDKDEAIKQYKTYLQMDPEGIHAKAAAKALAALAPK
jgi:Tfp pilus assembly protein PilF